MVDELPSSPENTRRPPSGFTACSAREGTAAPGPSSVCRLRGRSRVPAGKSQNILVAHGRPPHPGAGARCRRHVDLVHRVVGLMAVCRLLPVRAFPGARWRHPKSRYVPDPPAARAPGLMPGTAAGGSAACRALDSPGAPPRRPPGRAGSMANGCPPKRGERRKRSEHAGAGDDAAPVVCAGRAGLGAARPPTEITRPDLAEGYRRSAWRCRGASSARDSV